MNAIYLKLIGVAIVAFLGWFAYNHYTTLVAERDQFLVDKNTLEREVKEKDANITNLRTAYATQKGSFLTQHENYQTTVSNLSSQYQKERGRVHELEEKLSRHEFGTLAKKKPGLIRSRINNATQRVFADIQNASG